MISAKFLNTFSALLLTVCIAACGGGNSSAGAGSVDVPGQIRISFAQCEAPRPQACTRDYRPVCGAGVEGALATYPNACSACADHAVTGYYQSACSAPGATVCPEPRPQLCTADYRPACGISADGGGQTFANACSACSVSSIIGFADGECPGQLP